MKEFEKLGVFYLGRTVDPSSGKRTNDLLLYNSKDLTTHAVCVGMTGSGKTGLGITILEEAGLDKIPAIVIDPKGDLSNLLLTFPSLTPDEFKPWVDLAEAERKGMSPDAYAEDVATKWKKGLAEWGEDAERIQDFKKCVNLKIYTPASKSGIPISILNSFDAPSKEDMLDPNDRRDRILSTTSSLLGLLGIKADPINSREHILISTLIDQAWDAGKDLSIASLIQEVQKPPFNKVGALDVDTFYPPKERMELSIRLNNLLASPGFKAWMEGEPLNIKELLYSKEGKPNISIISIAHLSDSERMFFVTLLLNQFVSWTRRQEGTSSLRAILYMDEIFGFFPPTAMPPSKVPMLTLLKQARAYGVGIVLVTQNPVDLDYKGLSNCGTWFIGKLQTERDKARVIEGLKIASNGELDSKTLDKMIALTGNRIFLMRSVHEKEPILFQTRWTLSYLAGPMTLLQISKLTDTQEAPQKKPEIKKSEAQSTKPNVPSQIEEFFLNKTVGASYEPQILGIGKLHFVDTKNKVDVWKDVCIATSAGDDGKSVNWDAAVDDPELKSKLTKAPLEGSTFDELPSGLMQEKSYSSFAKAFSQSLYQNQTVNLFDAPVINMKSKEGETEGDFRVRIIQGMREERDALTEKLRDKYESKIAALTAKLKKAQDKLADKQQKVGQQWFQTLISFGTTLIGALLGKKVTKGTITETGTSIRRATQIGKEQRQATTAEEDVKICEEQLNDLENAMSREIESITTSIDADHIDIQTISIRPRKNDISIEKIALLWRAK